jgi:hypothetical protein
MKSTARIAAWLLATAFLPMADASADDIYVPDPSTFVPTQVSGIPPYSPQEVMGTESWSVFSLTTNTVLQPDVFSGVDTQTVIGSFINDDFAGPNGSVDLADFGGGWENEWLDALTGPNAGVSDLLITPFGDFELFGTFPF